MGKMSGEKEKDKAKTHKLSLKGSSKLVAEFFEYAINTILFQRGVYPADDFNPVKKYGLTMLVSSDDQVKAYIKKIMGQLDKWLVIKDARDVGNWKEKCYDMGWAGSSPNRGGLLFSNSS